MPPAIRHTPLNSQISSLCWIIYIYTSTPSPALQLEHLHSAVSLLSKLLCGNHSPVSGTLIRKQWDDNNNNLYGFCRPNVLPSVLLIKLQSQLAIFCFSIAFGSFHYLNATGLHCFSSDVIRRVKRFPKLSCKGSCCCSYLSSLSYLSSALMFLVQRKKIRIYCLLWQTTR